METYFVKQVALNIEIAASQPFISARNRLCLPATQASLQPDLSVVAPIVGTSGQDHPRWASVTGRRTMRDGTVKRESARQECFLAIGSHEGVMW